jgi:hypothetical protein
MLESIASTKQLARSRDDSVYRYYAGYPTEFVSSLLDDLGVRTGETVLDPWNGAGTTTEVCAFRGINSIGIDANPFMRTVAAVRSMFPASIAEPLVGLEAWLRRVKFGQEPAPAYRAAAQLLRRAEDANAISRDDDVACFIFGSVTRAMYKSSRSSNPTWYSKKTSDDVLTSEWDLAQGVLTELDRLAKWAAGRQISATGHKPPLLFTGEASSVWIGRRVDHIISSPPYLTRIDYVQKTLPELKFLEARYHLDIQALRRTMLGTVLTEKHVPKLAPGVSETATSALRAIKRHSSKASKSYYSSFFAAYFARLLATLTHLEPHLTAEGSVTLVTQGSYYKEVHIDLPLIVAELMGSLGFKEDAKRSFKATTHMAAVNTRTFASKQDAPEEVVSTFRRH